MTKIFSQLLLCTIIAAFASCSKWQDSPAKDLGLTNKYCNIPAAINYNHNFPGIEDNSVCIYPNEPFVGTYAYRDSIYDGANNLQIGDSITFNIVKEGTLKFSLLQFCQTGGQLKFTADRYYRAYSDTIISAGTQLMCRTEDTLIGTLLYRNSDSSMYIDWKVYSDTSISSHKGRAYKK